MVSCLLPWTSPVASSPKAVSENMQKLQEDRAFLQKLVQETLGEVGTDGTFNGLKAQLQDCHQEKTSMEEAILRWAHARPLESRHVHAWPLESRHACKAAGEPPCACVQSLQQVLCCTVLYCTVLSCPVLSCPVLSCPVLSCPVLSCPVLSCPVCRSCESMASPWQGGRVPAAGAGAGETTCGAPEGERRRDHCEWEDLEVGEAEE